MKATTHDWEQTFRTWSKPSSDTEQSKAENAERMIREAISEHEALARKEIEVFAQGSYKNNTNVREDSDVDICVCLMRPFFTDFSMAEGVTERDAGLSDSNYTYAEFKSEVGAALVSKFGEAGVTPGDKAFDVHENSYRVDADVVACLEHRRYTRRGIEGQCLYESGTEFRPDKGGRIINWPHHQYDNGIWKNKETGNRFKYITRVLKRLRNDMVEAGIEAAAPIPSFLLECLVWNVPDEGFGHAEYADDVRYAFAHAFNQTISDETCNEWGEVNELKYLFRPSQPWAREQAHEFLGVAWDYVGFD